ncbi:sugar O-acetyltransferase, partial [bacterium]|nr:sugar O-acetyltransferase [bacterium]
MLTEKEKMVSGRLYDASDPDLRRMHLRARRLCGEFNAIGNGDEEKGRALLLQLFGRTVERFQIVPPFHCDYGWNIEVGENFYANTGCVILDVGPVRIGRDVKFGPYVQIYTACHPVDPDDRRSGLEMGHSISIGENVWIGGGTVVNPGVSIGRDTVIGSGSVV